MKTRSILLVLTMAVGLKGYIAIESEILCPDEMGADGTICDTPNASSEFPQSCEDDDGECGMLRTSIVDFHQVLPSQKLLRIALVTNITSPLKIIVVSGNCTVECTGGMNACETNVSEPIHWTNVRNDLYIDVLDTSKYYCIRASIAGCCLICTKTIELKGPIEGATTEIKVVPMAIVYLSTFVVFIVCTLAALVLTKHLCGLYFSSKGSEFSRYSNLPFENSNESTSMITTTGMPVPMMVVGQISIDLLLLYSRENQSMHFAMEIFRYLLQNCGLRVWDPFDRDELENVRSGRESWLENIMQMTDLRVVLVETELAVKRQKPLLDDNWDFNFHEPHELDNVFIYGLSRLQNSVDMCNNYKRLFIVRFNGDDIRFQNLVPLTRYNLPSQWKNLVSSIYGRGSEDIDAIPMSEELESALESSITRLLESSPIEYQLTRVK